MNPTAAYISELGAGVALAAAAALYPAGPLRTLTCAVGVGMVLLVWGVPSALNARDLWRARDAAHADPHDETPE